MLRAPPLSGEAGRGLLKFERVTERGDDGDVAMTDGLEGAVAPRVKADLDVHRVEAAVGVVGAEVPDVLAALAAFTMEIEAHIEAMIGRQAEVVGFVVDEARFDDHAAVGDGGAQGIVAGQRHAVAGVVGPSGHGGDVVRDVPARREVEHVAIVELVKEPPLVEIGEVALAPSEGVGGGEGEARRAVAGIELHTIGTATARRDVVLPIRHVGHDAAPLTMLEEVVRQFVVALKPEAPMFVGLGVEARSPLPGRRGAHSVGRRYPEVGGERKERAGDAVDILRHTGAGGLRRKPGEEFVSHGETRIELMVRAALDKGRRIARAEIERKAIGEPHFVFAVEREFGAVGAVARIGIGGVDVALRIIIEDDFIERLRTESVVHRLCAEANVVAAVGSEVEVGLGAEVAHEGAVVFESMGDGIPIIVGVSSDFLFIDIDGRIAARRHERNAAREVGP